jgi:hypothetical protein
MREVGPRLRKTWWLRSQYVAAGIPRAGRPHQPPCSSARRDEKDLIPIGTGLIRNSETVNTMAEEAPGADSIVVQLENLISTKVEGSLNQQEIERRREIVRQFFNDFWMSTDDKPRTFAEHLNRAEDHINEQLAARGETWQLDAATRKQLGLPPPKTV